MAASHYEPVGDVKPIVTSSGLVYPKAPDSMALLRDDGPLPSPSAEQRATGLLDGASVLRSDHGQSRSESRSESSHAPALVQVMSVTSSTEAKTLSAVSSAHQQPMAHPGLTRPAAVPSTEAQETHTGIRTTAEWLPPSTPSNFGTPTMNKTHHTSSAEPSAKRQRLRHIKPDNLCTICGHAFRYIRHHYAKYHPNLVVPHEDGYGGSLSQRSPSFATHDGQQSWSGLGQLRPSREQTVRGHVDTHISTQTTAPRRTFGGVSAGRFCARCGLVVEDLDVHRRLEHGIPSAEDARPVQDALVPYENGVHQQPIVLSSAPFAQQQHYSAAARPEDWTSQARNAALRMDGALPLGPSRHNVPTPMPTHAQQWTEEQQRLASSRKEGKVVAQPLAVPQRRQSTSSPVTETEEQPYEKLIRVIRATTELTQAQRSSLIFDVLNKQVELLPHYSGLAKPPSSPAAALGQRRQSTAIESDVPETPGSADLQTSRGASVMSRHAQ